MVRRFLIIKRTVFRVGGALNMPPVNTVLLTPFDDTSVIDKKVKIAIQFI